MADFFAALNAYPKTALLCFLGLYLLLYSIKPIVINHFHNCKDDGKEE